MTAPKKTWKSVERRIARFFGAERTPLSGGNSGHTRSDTLHKKYFIEIKHRAKWAVFELWKETMEMAKKEKKMPFLCLHEKSKEGWMICVFSKDWKKLIESEYKRLYIDINICDKCEHFWLNNAEMWNCNKGYFRHSLKKMIKACSDFKQREEID